MKNHSLKSKKKEYILGVIIDENLNFNKKKMQNSLQHVNTISRSITISRITTAQSLHKNQTRIWIHNMGSHHLPKKPHEAT